MKAVRNATGHVMSKVGLSVEMMDWMSSRFRLDGYECAPLIGTTTVDNTSTAIGNVFRVKSGVNASQSQYFDKKFDTPKESFKILLKDLRGE